MKINFPRIVRPVDLGGLGEYAPELKGQMLFVWVNPPTDDIAALLDAYQGSLKAENEADRLAASGLYVNGLSVLLSQGKPDTHVSPAELQELRDSARATDPAFWLWLLQRVMQEINEHRAIRKKA